METAVHFPNWRSELVKQVPPEKRRAYSEAITKFLYWLRQNGRAPTLDVFREHVRWKKSYLPQDRFGIRREALLWYYRRRHPQPVRVFGVVASAVLTGYPYSTSLNRCRIKD